MLGVPSRFQREAFNRHRVLPGSALVATSWADHGPDHGLKTTLPSRRVGGPMAQSPGICKSLCMTGPPTPRLPVERVPLGASGMTDRGSALPPPPSPPHPILAGGPAAQPPSLTLRSPLSLSSQLSLAQKFSPFFKAQLKPYLFQGGFSHPRLWNSSLQAPHPTLDTDRTGLQSRNPDQG